MLDIDFDTNAGTDTLVETVSYCHNLVSITFLGVTSTCILYTFSTGHNLFILYLNFLYRNSVHVVVYFVLILSLM